jgi:molecular chaperone DnaK
MVKVGIDLGTTKSLLSIWKEGFPIIVPDRQGNTSTPSQILISNDRNIYVGRYAKNNPGRYDPNNITITVNKSIMGKQDITEFGWWRTCPQEITAFILAEIKRQAEYNFTEEITEAVIAIPSYFDQKQRCAVKEAASIAGINTLKLRYESDAALQAYGWNKKSIERIVVFDIGGGKLDIAVGEVGEGVIEVKSLSGEGNLGGDEFDQVIIDHILDISNKAHGSVELDSLHLMILKEAVEKAKIDLSSVEETAIKIPGFFGRGNKYFDLDIPFDRQTFESLSGSLFNRSIQLLNKAINLSGLSPSDIDKVFLIGGSSRIPAFREVVGSFFGKPPIIDVNSGTWVAQGAAIEAAVLKGDCKGVLMLGCTNHSFGIKAKNGHFTKIIDRNTTVPTKKSQVFSFYVKNGDNQDNPRIKIFEGEEDIPEKNTHIGTLEIKGSPQLARGILQIELTIDIDPNTIMHVSAKDCSTNKELGEIRITPRSLTDDRIRAMSANLNAWLSNRKD